MKISNSLTRKMLWVTGVLMLVWPFSVGSENSTLHVDKAGYVDTHNHAPLSSDCVYDDAYDNQVRDVVLEAVDDFGIQMTLFMPPPHSLENMPSCNYEHLPEIVKRHPERFAFLWGGETLNPMIQAVVKGKATLEEIRPQFVKRALEILRAGAVGFGELAAEHFSLHEGHPYVSAPPGHPLFLLLADLAADHDVPVDLHLEAIAQDTPITELPECSAAHGLGSPNPEIFSENITAFEQLLRHNRGARIVWAHAGWDNTGHRTPTLTRQLLEDHPNLYVQLRPLPRQSGGGCNRLIGADGNITGEWLALMDAFRDRFVVGLDSFYSKFRPDQTDEEFTDLLDKLLGAGKRFMNQLRQFSPALAHKVGYLNAVRIYNLNRRLICHRPGTRAEATTWVDVDALSAHLAHGDSVGPCG